MNIIVFCIVCVVSCIFVGFGSKETMTSYPTADSIRNDCSFTSGNLLLTQPNEFYTKHFLAELSTSGDIVCYYDMGIKLSSGIIDVKFVGQQGYVLDALDGVFLVNSSGLITRQFGKKGWPTTGESLFGMDFDSDQNLYVADLGTNSKRDTKILKFSKDEEYLGVFLDLGTEFVASDILTTESYLWLTGRTEIRKYSLKDGTLSGTYKSLEPVRFYGGIVENEGLYYVNSEGVEGSSFDHVTVFDPEGKVKSEFDLYPEKKELGGCPTGMVVDKDQLYVMFSDPFASSSNVTQHVQVFGIDGSFVKQFGGHECTTELCQSFNGLAVIP